MNPIRSTPCSEHRYARFLAWAFALIAWVLFGAWARATHARRAARFRHLTLHDLQIIVRNLILIRSTHYRSRVTQQRAWRNDAPAGFRRRLHTSRITRACAGVWLRRRLQHRGALVQRVLHLLDVLTRIDALARELAHRRRHGLTRLRPLILTRAPSAEPLCAGASFTCAADSS